MDLPEPEQQRQTRRLAASRRIAQATPAAALRQLLIAVEQRLEQASDDAVLQHRRASLLRQLGDLDAARQAYAALPPDAANMRMLAILAGAPVDPTGLVGPVPFIRVEGFLGADDRRRLWEAVTGPSAEFAPATVNGREGERVDSRLREAVVLSRPAEIRRWFIPLLDALIEGPQAPTRLGIVPFEIGERVMQVTRHDDGGALWPHRDRGSVNYLRQISYVYYFHRQPRGFDGGDLLLFDDPDAETGDDGAGFTRITPDDNCLILFPPDRLHCVTPVVVRDGDPLNGRWTVNGWVHRAEER